MNKRNFIKSIAGASLCIIAACITVSCGGKKSPKEEGVTVVRPRMVTVMAAASRNVDQTERFTGTVEAYNLNNISPQTPARIERIFVEVGDHVTRGQKLAQMDPSNLKQAKLQMENRKIEFERTKQLYEVGGASKSQYDTDKMSYEVAETSYNNLLTNTYLISPISGVVTARKYDAGDMFMSGNPLFTVEQIRPVKIVVNASERLYGKIKKGSVVDITFDAFGNEVFKGSIHLIYPSIDPATRSFPMEITIPNNDERIRPGMFARVTVKYAVENNIVVPDVAVVKQTGSGDHYVYTVADGKVVFKKVVLGQIIGTEYEIKSGIGEGDMIIIEGQHSVNNGQEVETKVGEPAKFVPDNVK